MKTLNQLALSTSVPINGLSSGLLFLRKGKLGFVVIAAYEAYMYMGERHPAYEYKLNHGWFDHAADALTFLNHPELRIKNALRCTKACCGGVAFKKGDKVVYQHGGMKIETLVKHVHRDGRILIAKGYGGSNVYATLGSLTLVGGAK